MKKLVLSALAGSTLLALTACGGADEAATDEAASVDDTAAVDESATVDMSADGSTMTGTAADTVEGTADDTVTISEDGVDAQINDGDTTVTADIDEDPSMTVQD